MAILLTTGLLFPLIEPGRAEGAPPVSDEPGGASGRAAGAAVEWVNPVPTASNFYGAAWKNGSDGPLLVGQAGTVVKYRPFSTPKFVPYQSVVTESLNAIAYRPGSETTLVAGEDGTLLLYDGNSFTPLGTGTTANLNDVAWKPDGSGAVIAGDDGTVLIYDGIAVTKLPALTGYDLNAVAWAASSEAAVLVGDMGIACLCNLTGASLISTGASQNLYDVAYRPDGALAAAVGAGGTVLSFDGQLFKLVDSVANQIFCATAWDSEGSQALLVGYDSTALATSTYKLTGPASSLSLSPIANSFTGTLWAVVWQPGAPLALVAGARGLVAEYGSGAFTVLSAGITAEMSAVAWNANGSGALMAGAAGYVAWFDGSNFTRVPSNSVEDLRAVAWHPGGDSALIVGRENVVLRYNASNGSIERLDTGLMVPVNFTSVSWKPDGSYALLACDGGRVVKYDGSVFTPQQFGIVNCWDVAWRPDGAFALIAAVSGNLFRYEERTLPPYYCVTKVPVSGAPPPVNYYSLSWRTWHGNQEALIAGSKAVVALYNNSGAFCLRTESQYDLYSIACVPNSGYALTVGTFGRMLLYTDQQFLRVLNGVYANITLQDVSWRPDGSYALVLGQSGVVLKYHLPRPAAPKALISWPRAGSVFEPGATILFEGSNSTPTFESPVTYYWESNISGKVGDGPVFTKVLSAGRHRITLFVNDSLGHSSSALVQITVKAPNRAPVLQLDSPVDGRTYNHTDAIEFDASRSNDPDGDPMTFYWISSRAGALGSQPAFNTTLNIGSHVITLWLNDTHYNISKAVTITVVMANRPPVAVMNQPAPNSNFTTKDQIRFDAAFSRDDDGDPLSYYWTSDLSGFLGQTSRFSRTLPAGVHRITVWVDDTKGGNVSATVNVTVVKANEPPTIAVDAPSDGVTVSGPLQMSGVAMDPEGASVTVHVQIDDGDWMPAQGAQSWSYGIDTTNLSNGQHVLRAKASDGTLDSSWVNRTITVHNPFWGFLVTIDFPLDGTAVGGKVRVMGTASRIGSSIVAVEVRIDNGSWQVVEGTSPWEFSWDAAKAANGNHRLTVRAYDGTDHSPEISVSLKVDNKSTEAVPWTLMVAATVAIALAVLLAILMFRRGRGGPTETQEEE